MIKQFVSDHDYKSVAVESKLDEALNKVTEQMCEALDYGDEIELNDTYTLYRHSEEDMWDVFTTDDWEHVACVMWTTTGDIVFDIQDKSLMQIDL